MADLSITADDLLAMDPCDDWPESRIREIAGNKRWTALEILSLEQVPAEDRLWVVLRLELISEPTLHELACRFAEESLPIWEQRYPDDCRPRAAIAAKRAWLQGEITDDQLAATQKAAWAAARAKAEDAIRAAARAAAWAAAWATSWYAARYVAWYVAWDAACDEVPKRQIEIVRKMLESEVSDG